MASAISIQAQWELNETVNSAIAIAKGVLRAATSDNVQPLAIISAEAFGATLAMCRETQIKVEQAARQHHTSYVVDFLKGKIGYANDDCAYQLSSSSGGVKFLGLAAALLCMKDIFTASRALEMMMKSSASHGQLLPTTMQLRDLLTALEYKLNRMSFAENVVGWETFLTRHPDLPNALRLDKQLPSDHPSVEALQTLVDALRMLRRIGESSTKRIQIKAGSCAPWVIAFIKWCTGELPDIILRDGTLLAKQLSARVTVVATMDPLAPMPKHEARGDVYLTDSMVRRALDVDVEIETFLDSGSPAKI